MGQERRLLYVAITRAKDRLFLTDTLFDYNEYDNIPSRFLKELEQEEIQFVDENSKERISEKINNYENATINKDMKLKVGDKVEHSIFGTGIVENINFENKTYAIKFDKFDTIRNISTHIKLEKIEEDI